MATAIEMKREPLPGGTVQAAPEGLGLSHMARRGLFPLLPMKEKAKDAPSHFMGDCLA